MLATVVHGRLDAEGEAEELLNHVTIVAAPTSGCAVLQVRPPDPLPPPPCASPLAPTPLAQLPWQGG